jgi:hypothetical protein
MWRSEGEETDEAYLYCCAIVSPHLVTKIRIEGNFVTSAIGVRMAKCVPCR